MEDTISFVKPPAEVYAYVEKVYQRCLELSSQYKVLLLDPRVFAFCRKLGRDRLTILENTNFTGIGLAVLLDIDGSRSVLIGTNPREVGPGSLGAKNLGFPWEEVTFDIPSLVQT